jgi:hypothetical protein
MFKKIVCFGIYQMKAEELDNDEKIFLRNVFSPVYCFLINGKFHIYEFVFSKNFKNRH